MEEEHKFSGKKMYIDEKGYPCFKDSGILVHIYNAKKYIREIKDGEEVHHIDGNKLHFHSENLIILSKEDHSKIEKEIRKQKNLNIVYILIIGLSFVFFIASKIYSSDISFWIGLILLFIGANLHEYPYLLRKILFKLHILSRNTFIVKEHTKS